MISSEAPEAHGMCEAVVATRGLRYRLNGSVEDGILAVHVVAKPSRQIGETGISWRVVAGMVALSVELGTLAVSLEISLAVVIRASTCDPWQRDGPSVFPGASD